MPLFTGRNTLLIGFRNARPYRTMSPASIVVAAPLFDNYPQMAVVENESVWMVTGQGLPELLQRPLR